MVKVALAPTPSIAMKRPSVAPKPTVGAPIMVPKIAAKRPATSVVPRKPSVTISSPAALSPVAASSPASSPSNTTTVNSNSTVNKISTSKVWVLPPRPKPGRKPSVDTPQNKRKAQNRAAQRAFRERRAAMVGELEERLDELRQERDAREARLEAQLRAIIKENEDLKRSVSDLKVQMAKQTSTLQMASPAMSAQESPMDILDRVLEERLPVPNKAETTACTVCIKDDCICASVGIKVSTSTLTTTTNKRKQSIDDEPFEVDFTEMFSRPTKKQSVTAPPAVPSPIPVPTHRTSNTRTVLKPPADRCGFCSDGTPCVCAEVEASNNDIGDIEEDNTLPPIVLNSGWSSSYQNTTKLPALHPGPSREIPLQQAVALPSVATSSSSTPSVPSPSYECTGNPGTCMQCQTDPMSTLFCATLASRPEKTTTTTSIKLETPKTETKAKTIDTPGAFISASAAYRTLSRHKDFRSADFGALVGKLNTRGMQVEVNSVANVLRELDRRLYSS